MCRNTHVLFFNLLRTSALESPRSENSNASAARTLSSSGTDDDDDASDDDEGAAFLAARAPATAPSAPAVADPEPSLRTTQGHSHCPASRPCRRVPFSGPRGEDKRERRGGRSKEERRERGREGRREGGMRRRASGKLGGGKQRRRRRRGERDRVDVSPTLKTRVRSTAPEATRQAAALSVYSPTTVCEGETRGNAYQACLEVQTRGGTRLRQH